MRTCTKCGECKDETCFYVALDKPSGFYSQCKNCCSVARQLRYRKSNRDCDRDRARERARTVERRFQKVRARAKKKSIFADLTIEEFRKAIANPCYYCENKLGLPVQVGIGLDRLDPNLGYTCANVVSCCEFCNSIKNDLITADEMKIIADFLIKNRPGFIPTDIKMKRKGRPRTEYVIEQVITKPKKANSVHCALCTRRISRQATYCKDCAATVRKGTHTRMDVVWPTVENAIEQIKKSSRAQVARDLGVNFNTLTLFLTNSGINPKTLSRD